MKNTLILGLSLFLASCGTLQKWALRSSSPLFKRSGEKLTRERNWDFFRESAPANLKFLELLALQDRNNMLLKSVLVKGYAGYAFAVPETLALGDELSGVENSPHKQDAITFYTRALDYGLDYLARKKIKRQELLSLEEDKLRKKLKEELDEEDYAVAVYTGQAWGSLINLQKDNVALVAQIPRVKILFDFVCAEDPTIEYGICSMFYAQYEASRPKMLGGNPEKAKELYLAAMKKYPKHLLVRESYVQNLLIPAMEKEEYEKEAKVLRDEFALWEDLNRDDLTNKSSYRKVQNLNLYNAVAKKRLEMIEKNKSKIF